MNTLSACIIIKNDCNYKFKRCLESLKECEEIVVVVDNGPKDTSLKLAKRYTNKIIPYDWQNDFAHKRNMAIYHATQDYILTIDDDEWFEEGELQKIKQALGTHDIYTVKQNNILKGTEKNLIVRHNRVFRNNKKIFYSRISHEDINIEGFTRDDLPVQMLHDGYIMTKKEAKEKLKRNIELHIKQLSIEPNNPMTYFYLARCYMQTKDYDLAGSFATLALITRNLPNDHKSQLCILLHDVWVKKNNIYLAIQYMARAIDLVPRQRRARWGMANFLEANGKYEDAIKELEYILSLNGIETDLTGDLEINPEQIKNNISIIKQEFKNASL